jgi:hypothetical protein
MHVRPDLEEDGDGNIIPHIDWDVQKGPELEGADDELVCE